MTIAIDTEATGLFIHKGCRAFTISACCDQGEIYLWKFRVDPFTREVQYEDPLIDDFRKTIKAHERLVFHNANFDLQALDALGVSYEDLFADHEIHDTMLMSHAWKSDNRHGLKDLALYMLDYPDDDEHELAVAVKKTRNLAKKEGWLIADEKDPHISLVGTQKTWWKADYWVPEEYAVRHGLSSTHPYHSVCDLYAGKDAERTMGLDLVFRELLKRDLARTYNRARKLLKPILHMQDEGVPVKTKKLKSAQARYSYQLDKCVSTLRDISKSPEFNPASPQQLQALLFQKFGFEPVKYSAAGNPSTDKDVVEELISTYPTRLKRVPSRYRFLTELQRYRKIKTTLQYLVNYYKHSDNPERVLHTSYKQAHTSTTRLSAENPTTMNVGKADMDNPYAKGSKAVSPEVLAALGLDDIESSFKLREVFGPKKGNQWTCADYQQFQLRIFAVVSESKPLLEAFERGEDAHDAVARVIFSADTISDVQRTAAKAVNFGILFGAGPKKIELIAKIDGLYSMFTSRFPKAKRYLEQQSAIARRKGYIHTLNGYRLYVPRERSYAASCYVIQGTEAQIVREAMIELDDYNYDLSNKSPYRTVMMVHDELIFTSRIPKPSEQELFDGHLRYMMDVMEDCSHRLGIPAQVDAKVTKTDWSMRKDYVLGRG